MKLSHQNEPLSALTHFIAIFLSIAGLVLMLVFGAIYGTATHITGFAIFGTCLILLYSASAAYHFSPKNTKIKSILKRLDHAMIFILIAGTYTPIVLVMPQRGWSWCLFGIIWGLAIIGATIKGVGVKMGGGLSIIVYIIMGWLALIAIHPLMQWLTFGALKWLFVGGVLYTIGCVFFALDKIIPRVRWFGMHEIFHLFVMAGSFCHFWLMIKHIL